MTRGLYYTARFGLIWSASRANVRTITEAEAAAPQLVDMAITERSAELSDMWVHQLTDLIAAIREARQQIAQTEREAA